MIDRTKIPNILTVLKMASEFIEEDFSIYQMIRTIEKINDSSDEDLDEWYMSAITDIPMSSEGKFVCMFIRLLKEDVIY